MTFYGLFFLSFLILSSPCDPRLLNITHFCVILRCGLAVSFACCWTHWETLYTMRTHIFYYVSTCKFNSLHDHLLSHSWNVNLCIYVCIIKSDNNGKGQLYNDRKEMSEKSVDVHSTDEIPLIIIKRDINCQLACVNSELSFF